jgi:hypothetical protein
MYCGRIDSAGRMLLLVRRWTSCNFHHGVRGHLYVSSGAELLWSKDLAQPRLLSSGLPDHERARLGLRDHRAHPLKIETELADDPPC